VTQNGDEIGNKERGEWAPITARGGNMTHEKTNMDQATIYIPKKRLDEKIMQRILKIGDKRQRSFNWICIEAITEYLERNEAA